MLFGGWGVGQTLSKEYMRHGTIEVNPVKSGLQKRLTFWLYSTCLIK